ncbi:MAG: CoA transferase, partial [Alphaproteobacteria bacterium]|nr:CoA transferase [Alphaproteobacteria bacterium]
QKDVCFAPVLSMSEAVEHPQNVHRGTFIDVDGVTQPGPAPRFERTPSAVQSGCAYAGEQTREALSDWGFPEDATDSLLASGAAKQR